MKFNWKEQELAIHSEGSHSSGHAPIIDEDSQGTDIYKVELFNATSDDLDPQPPMPFVYKMIVRVMH